MAGTNRGGVVEKLSKERTALPAFFGMWWLQYARF